MRRRKLPERICDNVMLAHQLYLLCPQVETLIVLQCDHRKKRTPFPGDTLMQALHEILLLAVLVEQCHLEKQRTRPRIRYRVYAFYIFYISAHIQAFYEIIEKIIVLLLPAMGAVHLYVIASFFEIWQERNIVRHYLTSLAHAS